MSTEIPTVRGPISPDDLGVTLLHEHVFIANPEGIANHNHTWGERWWDEEERVAAAIRDLQELRDVGVRTIADPTAFGLGRDVHRLARVNAEVDINIIVCSGIYAFIEVPAYLKYRPAEDLADIFRRDIETGIDDTGIRAAFLKCAVESYGVIGDIPLILDAIALAQKATGVPVMVHTNAEAQTGTLALRELTDRGVDPTRIVIAHAGDSNDMDYLREIADTGATLGFDRFNIPNFNPDERRIETLLKLLDEGYIDRIHLSHDAATFNDFMQHNPPFAEERPSYTHIHREVLPKLLERGVTQEQIDEMLITNAKRFFAPQTVRVTA
jgi:phosphotriesterase-related protein